MPPGVPYDKEAFQFGGRSLIRRAKGAVFDRQVDFARAALQCEPIQRLKRDTEAPLTIGRFFGNIVDSFSNTSLRFSPDPETAYHELCDTDAPPTELARAIPSVELAHRRRVGRTGTCGRRGRCGQRSSRARSLFPRSRLAARPWCASPVTAVAGFV